MVSTAFGLVQTGVTFLSMVLLLVALSPLLAIIALIAPIPAFIADTRFGWRGSSSHAGHPGSAGAWNT